MSRIVVENLATEQQRAWIFVGLPDDEVPQWPGSARVNDTAREFQFVPVAGGVRIDVDLAAGESSWLSLEERHEPAPPFAMHPAVGASPGLLLPRFEATTPDGVVRYSAPTPFWPDNTPRPAMGFVRLLESTPAHQVWHLRTRIVAADLTIDFWATIGSGCSTVEFTMQTVYGSTDPDKPIAVVIDSVAMVVRVPVHVDFARRLGLPPSESLPTGEIRQQVAGLMSWGRASRVEVRGALLPLPDSARAQGRPMFGVSEAWKVGNKWGALGLVPVAPPGSWATTVGRREGHLNPPVPVQHHYFEREWAQPKVSGTTGEQPAFGCSACEEAVTQMQPWAIHELLWQCQSFALRPTGNKERNGDPILAADHPDAVTTNQRPDHRYSRHDMLGWPNPVPYSWGGSGYSTSDGQHRTDILLHGTYALTRDPAMRQMIDDHLQLDLLNLRGVDGPVSVSREVGRTMLARANQVWLGFEAARSTLDAQIEYCWRNAGLRRIPQDAAHPVRLLTSGHEEAKYGWRLPYGTPVRGSQPWQEAIAAIGLWAAWRVTGNVHAKELALDLAKTVVWHGFYLETSEAGRGAYHEARDAWHGYQGLPDSAGEAVDVWRHIYASRWRTEDPGSAHPSTALFPEQPNYDIVTEGACQRWTLAAVRLLAAHGGLADAARAHDLVAALGPAVRNWSDSRWWAIGP